MKRLLAYGLMAFVWLVALGVAITFWLILIVICVWLVKADA